MPDRMLDAARKGWENAFAPYSNFRVGAALRGADGAGDLVFSGCNVENATYGLTVCAERVAIFKAISEGVRSFSEILIYTAGRDVTPPCGACRQLIWEFCGDIPVRARNASGEEKTWRMSELLPDAFGANSLEQCL
ncbi:MAG TPA: cytidine deaminase [Bryobacteraceae bacterium]|nr:cytidine deaminase [Bryobacteraceae bacterium]